MSYKYPSIKELFTAICDAVRRADGTSSKINHQDIPDRIDAIPKGSGTEERVITMKVAVFGSGIKQESLNIKLLDENDIEEDNVPWSREL